MLRHDKSFPLLTVVASKQGREMRSGAERAGESEVRLAPSAAVQTFIEVDGRVWEVLESEFVLRCGGEVVQPPRRTFDFICRLSHAAGRTLSFDELLEQVWGGTKVSAAAIHQIARQARTTLGQRGTTPLEAVRGRGYRMARNAVWSSAFRPR